MMWQNYLKVGVRALTKNKTYAFINIFGLALGLAACLIILLYVRYETSYDSWMPDADRVFQIQTVATDPETGDRREMQSAPRPVGAALAKDFPQIELISKAEDNRVTILRDGQAEAGEILMVDQPFFRIFQIPFLHGDSGSVLSGAENVAISRSEAVSRFGTENAVGQTLTIVGDSGKRDLKVTGVFEDLPSNSHFEFTMVTPFKEEWECNWSCITGPTYLKLKPGVDPATIDEALPAWEKRNIPTQMVGGSPVNEGDNLDWRLVNLTDIHLSNADGQKPGNDRGAITTFSIVAVLILFMALVNFTNLATARASQRAREVALRKVLGAHRRQLVVQFLSESILLTALAMLLALALVELTLPAFSAFLEADLNLAYSGTDGIFYLIIALMLLVGLAGGLYPALYLSRYRPGVVLKANKSAPDTAGAGRLRNVLVIGQFAVSIGLIICTLVVYHQTLFASRSSAGFDREGLIQIEGMGRPEVAPLRDTIVREIGQIQGVAAVAGTEIVPASDQTLYTMVQVPGRSEPEKIGWYAVETGFFGAMRVPMLAGRKLSERFAKDSAYIPASVYEAGEAEAAQREITARGINIVVNEAAARRIGFPNAQSAVGKDIGLSLFGDEAPAVRSTIVGVSANSRFRSLREPIEPTIYFDNGYYRRLMIRYANADPAAVMQAVERVWKRIVPEVPLNAEFTDDKLTKMYGADVRRGQTFAGFALLSVVIACLGLFGLAAFTAERKTKEIGIRKVFGARVRDIVRLLAWQFSKPVIVANLIAWPIAWWVMRDWLNSFDARVDLGPGPFLLAGLLALAIAVGTIAGHAFKVARAKPIHALRYE